MSKTSDAARRAREALKDVAEAVEDEAKDLGRRGESALRHRADGYTEEIEEQTGRPLNRDYMRLALVLAIVGAVALIVAGVRALVTG